ncbi:hypothetical protein ACYF6T_06560 [Streptomyces sp. 7R007]
MSIDKPGGSDAERDHPGHGETKDRHLERRITEPMDLQSRLNERNDRLRRSLEAARSARNTAEVMPSKVAAVVAALVDLTLVARNEAFQENRMAYALRFDKQSTDRPPPTEADRIAYRNARGDLLDAAEQLMKELRAHHFRDDALQRALCGVPGPDEGEVSPVEKAVTLGFEIASYVSLRGADAEAWARKGLSEAARGSEFEAAVKVGQYLMGPSPLTLANDVTSVVGEAVRGINEQRLQRCVTRVSEAIEKVSTVEHPDAQKSVSPLKGRRPLFAPLAEPPANLLPPPEPPSREHPGIKGPSAPGLGGF